MTDIVQPRAHRAQPPVTHAQDGPPLDRGPDATLAIGIISPVDFNDQLTKTA
jgi:hypothetical protein